MVSAKHERKYPCAQFLLTQLTGDDTPERKARWCSLLQRAPRTGKGRQENRQTCKSQFWIWSQMCRKESRWSPISLTQIQCTWLLQGKIYSWIHPPHSSSFISALSLKEKALHGMFFRNESRAYFWVTSYNFAPHSAVQGSSFCWLLCKGMTSPQHPGLHWEKFFWHLLCGCCRVCRQKGTGAGQEEELQVVQSAGNVKQEKAVAVLKEGRENKIHLETQEKMMFEHLELHCGWMVRKWMNGGFICR